jgi:hypothetical protein
VFGKRFRCFSIILRPPHGLGCVGLVRGKCIPGGGYIGILVSVIICLYNFIYDIPGLTVLLRLRFRTL